MDMLQSVSYKDVDNVARTSYISLSREKLVIGNISSAPAAEGCNKEHNLVQRKRKCRSVVP